MAGAFENETEHKPLSLHIGLKSSSSCTVWCTIIQNDTRLQNNIWVM